MSKVNFVEIDTLLNYIDNEAEIIIYNLEL